MKLQLRTIFLLVAILLLLVFVGLNWGQFTATTTLSLLFTTVVAPLGMVMLGVVAFFTVFYAVVMARYQTASLIERAHTSRDLEKARDLAESAETSRFKELRSFLETELAEIRRTQNELLDQAEAAAVGLAETVLGETSTLERRLERMEGEERAEPDTE